MVKALEIAPLTVSEFQLVCFICICCIVAMVWSAVKVNSLESKMKIAMHRIARMQAEIKRIRKDITL